MAPITGIYKITNTINGKCYIGQSIDIHNRWIRHRSRAFQKTDASYETAFYRAMRKYGKENFTFEILEECSAEELSDREIYYIALYRSYDREYGYNMTLGGEGVLRRDRSQIIDLWNQGHFVGEIAKIISGSRNTVKQVLREANIDYEEENMARYKKSKSRSVEQRDLDLNLIKIWPSIQSAAKELSICKKSITLCCNYIFKQAGGYKWRYANRSETAALADLLD